MPLTGDHLEDGWSWVNLFSYGYHIKINWVKSSEGSRLLWVPPAWRIENWKEVRWDGDFLALLSSAYPEPIIIEFQPQSILSHPLGI